MRRKFLVWSTLTLIALVITPPAVGTYELMQDGNLIAVPSLRTDTQATYDLTVSVAGREAYTIAEYIEIQIEVVEGIRIQAVDHAEVIRITKIEHRSRLPHLDGRFASDVTVQTFVDPATHTVLGSQFDRTRWTGGDTSWSAAPERFWTSHWWEGQGSVPWDLLRGGYHLYDAPVNTTWGLRALSFLERDTTFRHADQAAVIDGVRVLGVTSSEREAQEVAQGTPCPLPLMDTSTWGGTGTYSLRTAPVHWYDGKSGLPFAIHCAGPYRDGAGIERGAVEALLKRTGLRESGAPFETIIVAEPVSVLEGQKTPSRNGFPEGDALPYSLAEADQVVRTHPGLDAFRAFAQGSTTIRIVEAKQSYMRHVDSDPADPLVTQVEEAIGQPRGGPALDAIWDLAYANESGAIFDVRTARPVHLTDGVPSATEYGLRDRMAMGAVTRTVREEMAVPLYSIDAALAHARAFGAPPGPERGHAISYEITSFTTGSGAREGIVHRHIYEVSWAGPDGVGATYYDATNGQLTNTLTRAAPQSATPPAPEPAAATQHSIVPRDGDLLVATTATVSATALLIAAWMTLHRLMAVFIFYPLYAKIARPDVLGHPKREEIRTFIERNPGASLGDIQKALGLGWGTTVHHLATLERNRFVVSRRSGRNRRFWLHATDRASEVDRDALLQGAAGPVLAAIREAPGIRGRELAARLGLAPSTVHEHVRRLVAAGLVDRRKEGNGIRLEATLPDAALAPRHT